MLAADRIKAVLHRVKAVFIVVLATKNKDASGQGCSQEQEQKTTAGKLEELSLPVWRAAESSSHPYRPTAGHTIGAASR
jgi:hypothetical protein